MKVLVTGSAGFIGGHVCRSLLSEGWEVTGFDVRSNGLDDVNEVTGDLLDLDGLTRAVAGHDVICHIGAIGDVYLAAEQPGLAASVNVVGTSNIASAAKENGARVVYASTWEVYGEPHYEPVDEAHPLNPDHPYNITKLGGEQMLLAAHRLHGVPAVALRLGTAYGLGMRTNSVFEIFIRRALAGEPITIQGDGSQGRQFTHARDIGRAFAMATRSEAQGMALNIVAPKMITIKQLAEQVVARYPTELTFGDPRPGDVPSSYVSADRAEEVLGWKAEVAFEDGMAELFEAPRN
ncbi:MAG TPA: NAD-dependent epimerase/dehydratase family protein [Acidimicrobiia bacterium]|nr:NAD-dependent epimerase/dehydratase family protein [Acidimicrobiia bacterium]